MKLRRESIKVRLWDRHVEHIDDGKPLCNHKDATIYAGDNRFVALIRVGGVVWAEVELALTVEGHIDVIVNQPDYMFERHAKEAVENYKREKGGDGLSR